MGTCRRILPTQLRLAGPGSVKVISAFHSGMRMYHLLVTALRSPPGYFEYPGFLPAITLTELFYNLVEVEAIMTKASLEREMHQIIPKGEPAKCCALLRLEFGVDGATWDQDLKDFRPAWEDLYAFRKMLEAEISDGEIANLALKLTGEKAHELKFCSLVEKSKLYLSCVSRLEGWMEAFSKEMKLEPPNWKDNSGDLKSEILKLCCIHVSSPKSYDSEIQKEAFDVLLQMRSQVNGIYDPTLGNVVACWVP